MSLVIRLMKTGKKGEAKYRFVVKEKRDKRDGIAVEQLGSYAKMAGGKEEKHVNMDRVKYWLSMGAQASATVKKILSL
jgi:small subunit ribosomal protein S16